VRAVPDKFFSSADSSQVDLASLLQLLIKLLRDAPASFLSSACDLHVSVWAAKTGTGPKARSARM
jgi:hypothetical protein